MEIILTILLFVVVLNYKNIKNFFGTKRVMPTYTASNPPELKRKFKTTFTCPYCGETISLSQSGVKTCPKCGSNIAMHFHKEKMEHLDYLEKMKTGGLYCPVCGNEDLYTTCIKGAFGNSHPAYECRKCNCKWKWHGY